MAFAVAAVHVMIVVADIAGVIGEIPRNMALVPHFAASSAGAAVPIVTFVQTSQYGKHEYPPSLLDFNDDRFADVVAKLCFS